MKIRNIWIPVLTGLVVCGLLFVPWLGVSSARAATITVDGDLSDWAGLTTFSDSASDAGGGSGDLTALWITFDSTNLYLRWDMFLTSNTSSVKSDAFAALLSNDGSGTMNAKVWVIFNSSGVPITQIEYPLGTFTSVGTAAQSCSFSPCANGAFVGVEAAVPYSGFNAGSIIGLAGLTLASPSTSSNIKDCIPGGSSCSGFISINRTTGEIAQATPTSTPTQTSTATNSGTATSSSTFTNTSTASYTPSDTPTFTATITDTPTSTSSYTNTSTSTLTYTPSRTPTRTPTRTASRTLTPSATSTTSGTPGKSLPLGIAATDTGTATPSSTSAPPTSTSTASSTATLAPSAGSDAQFFVTATPPAQTNAPVFLNLPGGGKVHFLPSNQGLMVTNAAGAAMFQVGLLPLGLLLLLLVGTLVAAPLGLVHLIVALPSAFDLELRNITGRIPVVRVNKIAQAFDYDRMEGSLGWLKRSVFPGKRGTCVVAGVYAQPDGQPGLFAQLSRLQKGDEVLLLPREQEFTYIVASVETVKDMAYVLSTPMDEGGLVLLTQVSWAKAGESQYLVVKALLAN